MDEFDSKIREALEQEDAEMLQRLDELRGRLNPEVSLKEVIAESFQGRRRWIVRYVWFQMLVFAGLGILGTLLAFGAQESNYRVGFAIGTVLCMMVVAVSKLWYWMELNRRSVLREVKRLEVQIARLTAALREDERVGSE